MQESKACERALSHFLKVIIRLSIPAVTSGGLNSSSEVRQNRHVSVLVSSYLLLTQQDKCVYRHSVFSIAGDIFSFL